MKTFKQVLSLVLAALMCLGVLILPAFAEEETEEDIKILMQQNWEDFDEGTKISSSTKDNNGNKPIQEIGPENAIMTEEREGQPNKFIRLDYKGHCEVNSGGSRGSSFTGNCDYNFRVTHDKITYEEARYCVFEIDFRWDAKDSKNARMQFQLQSGSACVAGAETPTSFSWADLFIVNLTKNQLVRESGVALPTTGAVEPIVGEWNQFRIIFDLQDGYFDIYINDTLYSMHNELNRSGHLTNITINANYMQCGKLMKAANDTYGDDIDGECGYIDMDNMRMYSTDMTIVMLDNLPFLTGSGKDLPLAMAGKTLLFTDYTTTVAGVDTTKRITADTITLTPELLESNLVINRHFMDGESYGADDFEWFADGTDDFDVTKDPFLTGFPAKNLDTIEQEVFLDENDEEVTNTYLHIPLIAADDWVAGGTGTGNIVRDDVTYTSMVDQNPKLVSKDVSYKDVEPDEEGNVPTAKYVAVTAKYRFSAGARLSLQTQYQSLKSEDAAQNWGDVYKIMSNGEAISITTELSASYKATAAELALPYDEWFTIVAVIDLISGQVKVYANGKLAVSGGKLKNGNLDVGSLMMFKLNKLNNSEATLRTDGYLADSYIDVDDLMVMDGPKANFTVELVEGEEGLEVPVSTTKYTEFIGSDFSVAPAGYFFKAAKLIETEEVEQKVQAVDEFGQPLFEDDGVTPIYVQATDDQGELLWEDEEKTIPVWETEIILVDKPVALDSATITVDFNLDGKKIVVYGSKDLFYEDYNEAANVYYHVPFYGTGASGNGNFDKCLQVKHDAVTEGATISVKTLYRPHYVFGTNETFEAQFASYKFTDDQGAEHNGQYMNLYKINLQTGKLVGCGTVVDDEAALAMDEWNLVELVLDTANGSYKIYLNGELYSEVESMTGQYYDAGWVQCPGAKNIKIAADQFIAGKCNKIADAYAEKDDETANYVDIDDISITEIDELGVVTKTLAEVDFNNGKAGATPATADGYAATFPVASYKTASVDLTKFNEFIGAIAAADGNAFISIPALAVNNGKAVKFANEFMDAEEYTASMVITADYRYNKAGAAKLAATVNGDVTLFEIDATTGAVTGTNLILVPGEWFNMKAIFNFAEETYTVFINDEVVAMGDAASIKGKSIVFAQISAAADTEVVFDVDNTVIRYQNTLNVKVNGASVEVAENEFVSLASKTKKFLYAKVEIPAGEDEEGVAVYDTTYVGDIEFRATVDGAQYTGYYVTKFASVKAADGGATVRLGTPNGLRFITEVTTADLSNIKNTDASTTIKVGTIIAPLDAVQKAEDFTKDALGADNFIDVEVAYNKYYNSSFSETTAAFAGSISNVKKANINRKFIARGYFTVTVTEGSDPITVYADLDMENLDAYAYTLAQAAADALASTASKTVNALKNTAVKAMVESFAEKLPK